MVFGDLFGGFSGDFGGGMRGGGGSVLGLLWWPGGLWQGDGGGGGFVFLGMVVMVVSVSWV